MVLPFGDAVVFGYSSQPAGQLIDSVRQFCVHHGFPKAVLRVEGKGTQ